MQLNRVGHPRTKSLQIALNRVRKCPQELVGEGNSDGTGSESPVATLEQIDNQGSNDSTDGLEYEDLSEDQESERLLSQDVEDNLEQESEDSQTRIMYGVDDLEADSVWNCSLKDGDM